MARLLLFVFIPCCVLSVIRTPNIGATIEDVDISAISQHDPDMFNEIDEKNRDLPEDKGDRISNDATVLDDDNHGAENAENQHFRDLEIENGVELSTEKNERQLRKRRKLICPLVCRSALIGNGICNPQCDIGICRYDGGDCCGPVCSLLRGNGVCNNLCDIPQCNYDGGDCYCSKRCRRLKGNGVCNLPCNTPGCRFDGGDCGLQNCGPVCSLVRGNGVCNPLCNTAQCGFDGGDCATPAPSKAPTKRQCGPRCLLVKGNGVCNPLCNTPECDFDGGDCVCGPICTAVKGNGVCNPLCNTPQCAFDGGDCTLIG